MRQRTPCFLLVIFGITFFSKTTFARENFYRWAVYGGYEYMFRTLELDNTANGTLGGPRLGLSYGIPLGQNWAMRLSCSGGFSTGENVGNSSTLREDFQSYDLKPTLSISWKTVSIGATVRYEIFKVTTSSNSSSISNIYRGFEFGPTVQWKALSLGSRFDFTLGAEYLEGNLSQLNSSQIGLKAQLHFNF